MEFGLKWNKELHYFPMGLDRTVTELKAKVFDLTGVQPENQKLMGLGKQYSKDDSILLSELRLKPKSKLVLIGSKKDDIEKTLSNESKTEQAPPPAKSNSNTVVDMIASVSQEVDAINTRLISVSAASTVTPPTAVKKDLVWCDEMLTRQLLTLDNLDVTGNQEAREKRKELVKFVTGLHGKVDQLRQQCKL